VPIIDARVRFTIALWLETRPSGQLPTVKG